MAVRIGLAFNLKPEAPAPVAGAESPSPVIPSHQSDDTALPSAQRVLRSDLEQPDLYAEWDEQGTIDAVAAALSTIGEVILLEANETFPERLRAAAPDFVINIAQGL